MISTPDWKREYSSSREIIKRSIPDWKKEYSSSRKIPWHLYIFKNRFSRAIIYMWTMFVTQCFLEGWELVMSMLFAADVYQWKCDPSDKPCEVQTLMVDSLYHYASLSHLVFGIVGGFICDQIGPMYTAAVGELAHVLGWILLSVSSQTVQLYIPGVILIGGSISLITLPALELADMFPSNVPLMLALLVAFENLASFIPVALQAIWSAQPHRSLGQIAFVFALIIVLPTAILFPLACPYKAISAAVKEEAKQTFQAAELNTSNDAVNGFGDHIQIAAKKAAKRAAYWKLLKTELTSPLLLLFAAAYTPHYMQLFFYPIKVLEISGPAVHNVLESYYPTIALCGVILILPLNLGYMSPFILLLISIIMTQLPFILSFTPVLGLHYTGIVIYTFCKSVLVTIKYVFFNEVLKPVNHGVVISTMSTIVGLTSLSNLGFILLPYKWVTIGYMCLAVCSCGTAVYLYVATNKENEKLSEPVNVTEKELMKFDGVATCLSSVSEIAVTRKPSYTTLDSDKSSSSSESEIVDIIEANQPSYTTLTTYSSFSSL